MKNFLITLLFFTSLDLIASNKDHPYVKLSSEKILNGHRVEMETVMLDDLSISVKEKSIIEWSSKALGGAKDSNIHVILTDDLKQNQRIELFLLKLKIRLGMMKNRLADKFTERRTYINEEAKRLAGEGKKYFTKHERISLSILRTVVNGATVSAGLIINGGISPEAGIAIGLFSGSLSGFFQYFNAKFQTLIDGNHEKNQKLISEKKYGNALVKTTQMSKWFFTEVGLYSVIKTFSAAIGVPTGSFTTEALSVLKSSVMATGSQGLWDSTIASETKAELRGADGKPSKQARIQMKSNIKTFAVSMASVFGGVMSLMGSNIGSWSLGALGVSGIIYTYFSFKKRQSSSGHKDGQFILISPNCRGIFSI